MKKAEKLFTMIHCPFLFGCRRSWLRCSLVFIFLWLMKSLLWSLHFNSKHSSTSLTFSENLSPQGRIPKTAIWWPFYFTDKANEIISLAISSGELTVLRSLVSVCRITRSVFFFLRQGFMALVWAPGNSFTRIMLSRLVLFVIDFLCKCFTIIQ